MSSLLPYPLISAVLLIVWLLLNESLSPGQILLGTVLAIAGGPMLRAIEMPPLRLRRPGAAIPLAGAVLADIVRSNIAVTQIILNPRHRKATSGFVRIPLDLRNRYGLAVLACIVTSTPGTLWVRFDSQSATLTLHVLDLVDEATWIETIKHRYERLLLEIFDD